ncbi:hypothetical protein GWK08_03025 [Leptobacterium flavescens]|uniref:Uncharacterized protein n=1 Tax=Leptobacterium flavescens TaxID=472055 RepID=A0A6P0UGI2_9FLAO|nr:hypothetical protein [Leptobacterium flavescens]NER12401.1 hypothetical protein [Leptobacterium flavescens]
MINYLKYTIILFAVFSLWSCKQLLRESRAEDIITYREIVEDEESSNNCARLGTVEFKMEGLSCSTDRFLIDYFNPNGAVYLDWFTENPEVMGVIRGVTPDMNVSFTLHGEEARMEEISGSFPLNYSEDGYATLSTQFVKEGVRGVFTFFKGEAVVEKIGVDGTMKIRAKGSGWYNPDISRPEIVREDIEGEIEIDVKTLNISKDGIKLFSDPDKN